MENRSKERYMVRQQIDVRDIINGVNLGTVVNLSEEGFLLLGSKTVKENRVFQLMFTLAEPVGPINELALGAECLWVNPMDSGEYQWAGFRIIELSDEVNEVILALIDQIKEN